MPSSFAKQSRPSDPVSPTSSTSSQEELLTLRARNKILTEALAAIKDSASEEMKKKFDLVWFAKYRCKYTGKKWFSFLLDSGLTIASHIISLIKKLPIISM